MPVKMIYGSSNLQQRFHSRPIGIAGVSRGSIHLRSI